MIRCAFSQHQGYITITGRTMSRTSSRQTAIRRSCGDGVSLQDVRRSPFFVVTLIAATALTGCDDRVRGYLPVSELARNGFVSDQQAAQAHGRELRLWGFVDHGNLYGDAGAKGILGQWWAGEGPDATTWRFDLKGAANGAVGHSFAVHVPDDAGRENLLRRFVADARAGRPTKVFLTGRLLTFEAPTQFSALTGLYLKVGASQDIRLGAPQGEQRSGPRPR